MLLVKSVPWVSRCILSGRNKYQVIKLYNNQTRKLLNTGRLEAPVSSLQLYSWCRAPSQTSVQRPYSDVPSSTDVSYKPVYHFSHIVLFRLVCRAKLFQTGLVVFSVPLVYYLHEIGTLSTTMAYSFSGVVSLAAVMLYIMGEFFRKVVGIISLNTNMSTVQVSHLTFWGKRRDIVINTKDIIPLSDTPQNLSDVFVTIKFYNSDNTFYLFHKHGVIDAEKLKQILE